MSAAAWFLLGMALGVLVGGFAAGVGLNLGQKVGR